MHIQRLTASHAPVFLVNSRLGLVSAAPSGFGREVLHPTEAPLLPKLRGHFAEFLNQGSLDRLGILCLSTCVGLRYGHLTSSLEDFLGSVGSAASPCVARHRTSGLTDPRIFLGIPPTCLPQGQPSPGSACLTASPHRWPTTGWVGSPLPKEGVPLATRVRPGRG